MLFKWSVFASQSRRTLRFACLMRVTRPGPFEPESYSNSIAATSGEGESGATFAARPEVSSVTATFRCSGVTQRTTLGLAARSMVCSYASPESAASFLIRTVSVSLPKACASERSVAVRSLRTTNTLPPRSRICSKVADAMPKRGSVMGFDVSTAPSASVTVRSPPTPSLAVTLVPSACAMARWVLSSGSRWFE